MDRTTTYGTLEVPAHRRGQRLAAALLIPGSGPTDRDGNQPQRGLTPYTLQLVATILAREGVITLRFDKYFSGRTGAGAYASDPAAALVPAFLRQATAAYDFLHRQSATDPRKMLIVGHSEDGMFALLNPSNAAFVRSNDAIYPPALASKVQRGSRVLVTDGTPRPERPAQHHPTASAGPDHRRHQRARIPAPPEHGPLHAPPEPAGQRSRAGPGCRRRAEAVGAAIRVQTVISPGRCPPPPDRPEARLRPPGSTLRRR